MMQLEKIRKYWNQRAEGYSMKIEEQLKNEERQNTQRLIEKYAPRKTNMKCLDIGCGPGFLSIVLANYNHQVTAIDYSEEMLRFAKDHCKTSNVSVKFQQMDAQVLEFDDEIFDFIITRDLVWNLENPEKAYLEWMRVLKPGGRILILDGNYYLHYYVKDYEIAAQPSKIKHKYMLGIDSTPIDNIARILPLSKQKRPAWDIDYFMDIGASHIATDINRKEFFDDLSGKPKSIISNFALCIEKSETK